MAISTRVDVVMAFAPVRRIVMLAPTKQDGRGEALVLGIEPIAVVTPRSPHSARGIIADEIVEAPGLTPEEHAALMIEVAPCLATSGAE